MEWLKKTIEAFSNWPLIYFAKFTTNGGVMRHRNGLIFYTGNIRATLPIVYEVFNEDVYGDLKLQSGSIVMDIGANIGSFSLKALRAGAKVTSYEPSSSTFKTLQRNILSNGFSADIFQKAVGKKGSARLAVGSVEAGTNSLFLDGVAGEMVDCVTFADVIADIQHCDLMKIDCEGGEYDFILNASSADLRKVDRFILEWHDIAGHSVQELENHFTEAGFSTRLNEPHQRVMTVLKK